MNSLTARRGFLDDFFHDVAPAFYVKPLHGEALPAQIRVDVKETPEAYTLHAEVPGVSKEDIQVNVDGGETKSGISPQELPALAQAVAALPRLQLRGLMTIPEPAETDAQMRAVHAQAKTLLEALRQQGLSLDTLSMGMSADMESAIAEGSTMVRVGTAIFGKR